MSLRASEIIRPSDSAELELLIGDALENRHSLEIMGAGSKRALGQIMDVDKIVSLSRLTGITLYEPDELVLSARAGTPLAEIEAALAEHDQQLSFEPPDWGALLGSDIPAVHRWCGRGQSCRPSANTGGCRARSCAWCFNGHGAGRGR